MRISSLNFPQGTGLGSPEVFLVYAPFPNKYSKNHPFAQDLVQRFKLSTMNWRRSHPVSWVTKNLDWSLNHGEGFSTDFMDSIHIDDLRVNLVEKIVGAGGGWFFCIAGCPRGIWKEYDASDTPPGLIYANPIEAMENGEELPDYMTWTDESLVEHSNMGYFFTDPLQRNLDYFNIYSIGKYWEENIYPHMESRYESIYLLVEPLYNFQSGSRDWFPISQILVAEDSIRHVLPATSENISKCFPASATAAIAWCDMLKEQIKDQALPSWGDSSLDEIPYETLSILSSN